MNPDANDLKLLAHSCVLQPLHSLISILSPGGSNARLSILIFHRVLKEPDPLFPTEVDSSVFDAWMRLIAACFNILPLREAVHRLRAGSLRPRSACITFDDGYADNAEIALPILQKHGLTATFFVSTGFIDGGRMWNDTIIDLVRRVPSQILDLSTIGLDHFDIGTIGQKRQTIYALIGKLKYLPVEARQLKVDEMRKLLDIDLPSNLMMDSRQIRQLHNAGMEIGAHTVHHPILASADSVTAREEIANGKETLESIIGAPVKLFAYPNGRPVQDYHADHVHMVKELGFEGAVSTAWGAASTGSDLYQLPRFTPWDRGRVRFILRMAQNLLRTPSTV